MINKIIIFIIMFLSFSISVLASNISSEIKFISKNTELPIKDLVIVKADSFKNETRYLVTDKSGKISFDFPYSEEGNDISLSINGNTLFLNGMGKENNKNIDIFYDKEKERIDSINYKGDSLIDNQEIKKLTNYKLLIIFIFFTLMIGTIILMSRLAYIYMYIDVKKHKGKVV